MERGKIIVFEGLDGCGKGVQLQQLAQMMGVENMHRRDLRYAGRSIIFTREPGGTPFAEKMRTMIFSEKDLGGKTQMFNFFAARNDHWQRVVIPAVQRGDIVICDRSDASTYAFQLYGQNEGPEMKDFFWKCREFVYGEYEPDLYLFIDVSPEECQRRLKEAAFQEGREVTHFDTRALDFHHKVRNGYVTFGCDNEKFIRVNGEQAILCVHRDIRQAINLLLASSGFRFE